MDPNPQKRARRICRFYYETGKCTKGNTCTYKHERLITSEENRRETTIIPTLYKTRMCRTWIRGVNCQGVNCLYAHGHAELLPVPSSATGSSSENLLDAPPSTQDAAASASNPDNQISEERKLRRNAEIYGDWIYDLEAPSVIEKQP